MTPLPPNSFTFGTVNSVEAWGMKVVSHDLFMPPKRARKVTIPGRSGTYDYGAKNYDERTLSIECTLERQMSRAEFRMVTGALSKKNHIILWDEPDKYYVGELYDAAEITTYPGERLREVSLSFLCEPFAYKTVNTVPLQSGQNKVRYEGTAEAPGIIELRNTNAFSVSNIVITIQKKRS